MSPESCRSDSPLQVRFRWFRTIRTDSDVITFLTSPTTQECQEVELVWDRLKMLYESTPSLMRCGRHSGALRIDDKVFPLQTFMIVPATFEVNLFLLEESPYIDGDSKMERLAEQPISFAPLSVDTSWSNAGITMTRNGSCEFTTEKPSYISKLSADSFNIYDELLASKDREILLLREELKDLKLVLLNLEADVNTSNMKNNIKQSEMQNIHKELSVLQNEKKCLELETGEMTQRMEDQEEARESLEWEVEQLKEQLSSNDPAEVAQLLEEMKSLRRELRSACKKNGELCQEVLSLRELNAKLSAKEFFKEAAPRNHIPNETIYFSDPDSEGTRYRELPVKMEPAYSMPTFGSPRHVPMPKRRAASLTKESDLPSPLSSGSSLSTEELLDYPILPLKTSSGMQTDITALGDKPRHYLPPSSGSLFSSQVEDIAKKNGLKRCLYSRCQEEHDSSDTEELLQEAEEFIRRVHLDMPFVIGKDKNVSNTSSSHFTKLNRRQSAKIGNTSSSIVIKSALKNNRPFIPKSIVDVGVGHTIRYHGLNGRIVQGTVMQIESSASKLGYFIGLEDSELMSPTSRRTFVPFKKVIIAWEG